MARFEPADAWQLPRAALRAVRLEAMLRRRVPLPRIAAAHGLGFLADPGDPAPGPPALDGRTRRWVTNVDRVMRRGPFPDTCLRRALLYGIGLRTLGPTLVIGVRRGDGGIEAHAWVRVGGRDLDPLAARFDEFERP